MSYWRLRRETNYPAAGATLDAELTFSIVLTTKISFFQVRRLVRKESDVSQKHIASIFKVEINGGQKPAVATASCVFPWRTTSDWKFLVRFPTVQHSFSFLRSVQTGSGVHPVSFPMCTDGSFAGVKAAGASS
jgi:hypothetical protein